MADICLNSQHYPVYNNRFWQMPQLPALSSLHRVWQMHQLSALSLLYTCSDRCLNCQHYPVYKQVLVDASTVSIILSVDRADRCVNCQHFPFSKHGLTNVWTVSTILPVHMVWQISELSALSHMYTWFDRCLNCQHYPVRTLSALSCPYTVSIILSVEASVNRRLTDASTVSIILSVRSVSHTHPAHPQLTIIRILLVRNDKGILLYRHLLESVLLEESYLFFPPVRIRNTLRKGCLTSIKLKM